MKKLMEQEVVFTEQDIVKIMQTEGLSKSKKMIALFNLGLETKEIAEVMTSFEGKVVRYNFVYNVLSNHCNMNGIKIEAQERTGKKELILELWNAGKSNKEISIELKTNYNYVFNTIKDYKKAHPDVKPVTVDVKNESVAAGE